jgi:hypothetical protein
LDFIRLVSWLYALWHEAGRVSATVLRRAVDTFDPESSDLLSEHLSTIASHRTLMHHDLGAEVQRGGKTMARCEAWFDIACGAPEPTDPDAWRSAHVALCTEARLALEAAETTLQLLGADAGASDWVRSWRLALEREFDDGDLDKRVKTLARQLGVGPLRSPEFRRRFRARWMDQVRLCPAPDTSATLDRAITRDLLDHGKRQHPLLPREVMACLGLEEGPLVGDAMRLARSLYDLAPCPPEELLRRLADNWAPPEA